ncbi:MAG TPA: cation:proton antiporter [Solirubrobacterales bacterium]|nr:cation:proton antiporter [Solirubrobacterales bacterium]
MILPLGAVEATGIFLELGALMLALAFLAWLGGVLDLSSIPLYLLGGVVAGVLDPFALSEGFIELGAQIGVVLLLFMLGLEYSAGELTANLRANLPAGLLDAGVNFGIGLLAGLALGWGFTAAFLLGGATYISSSGVIAKVLDELGRLGNRETPSVLSLLVMEDLAMAAYLPIATVLIAGGAMVEAIRTIAIAVAATAGVLVLTLRYGRRLSHLVRDPSNEVLLLTLFGLMLVVGGAAEQVDISAAVGAFLIGIAVSGPIVERARALIAPLRDLFAATFFVFFGLTLDTGELSGVVVPAAALAIVSGASKFSIGQWAARRSGAGRRGGRRAGTVFIARGEFSIVIAGLGISAGVEPALGPMVATYVLITAIGGAVLTRFADRVEREAIAVPAEAGP